MLRNIIGLTLKRRPNYRIHSERHEFFQVMGGEDLVITLETSQSVLKENIEEVCVNLKRCSKGWSK